MPTPFDDLPPKYRNLSKKELKAALDALPVPLLPPARKLIERLHAAYKATLKKDNLRNVQLRNQWRELREPLKYEQVSVRTSVTHYRQLAESHIPEARARAEKWLAVLHEYEVLMQKIVKQFDRWHKEEMVLPSEKAHELNAKHPPGNRLDPATYRVRNNGWHWTDWPPPAIRDQMKAKFNALPDPPRGKRRDPFTERLTRDLFNARRERLRRAIDKEAASLEDQLSQFNTGVYDPNDHRHQYMRERVEAQLEAVNKAHDILFAKNTGDPLPATWHGLLPKKKTITRPGASPDESNEEEKEFW